MNKLTFGQYNTPARTSPPFSDSTYTDPGSATETRKQLSYPLQELRDFINSTIPVKEVSGTDMAIQLRVTASGLIQYSLDGTNWVDTASGGHYIFDEDGTQLAQKVKLMFKGTQVYNEGDYTVVEGIQGAQGVSVASMVQIEQSSLSGGSNKWRATLTNGTVYDFIVKNGLQGSTGEKGEQGDGLVILGVYATLEALATAHPTGDDGDVYMVGNSSDGFNAYAWGESGTPAVTGWTLIGPIKGSKGDKGDTGNQGPTGNGIQSIVVQESSTSGGNNVVTITMTGGQTYTFNIKNGEQGSAGTGVPTGGTTGQFLAKNTDLSGDTEWVNNPVPAGGTIGQVLTKQSSTDRDADWEDLPITDTYSSSSTDAPTCSAIDNVFAKKRTVRSNITVSGTPTALGSYQSWDTQSKYGYYLDVTISGLTVNTLVEDIILTDTIQESCAYVFTSIADGLRFYFEDNTAISGTIFTLVTSEVA